MVEDIIIYMWVDSEGGVTAPLRGSVKRPFANGRPCQMPMTNRTSTPVQVCDADAWHVQYRRDTLDHVGCHPSPEAAIEAACRLIDDGCDVYGIGTGPLTDSIGPKEIARIYALWAGKDPWR
jgi:hypothetical protein